MAKAGGKNSNASNDNVGGVKSNEKGGGVMAYKGSTSASKTNYPKSTPKKQGKGGRD